jgi:hypothetical protein
MHTKGTASIGVIVGLCLTAVACGGGPSDGTSTADSDSAITTDEVDPTVATEAEAGSTTDPASTVDDTPTTDPPAPTTTAAPDPEPRSFDLATLPDLLDSAVRATTDPTIAPLSIAQQLIGFPLEIPVPEGSRLYSFAVHLNFGADGSRFEFGYDAIGPGDVVPDIDITLDQNGPGSLQIIETWDPIMAALGFERANSTASDPGDPGGPNSVNHVYVTSTPAGVFNGVPGEVAPVFVWSTEDLNGWSYSPDREVLAGFDIDVDIETAPGAGIPVPIVSALLELLTMPDRLELSDAGVDLRSRSADSYDADKGLTYLEMFVEWEAPADMLDAVVAFFDDLTAMFPDEQTLMAGEEAFSDGGTIAPTEWYDSGDADKRLELLLLRRYDATLAIDASSDGVEPMTVRLRIVADPVAPVLDMPT